jgi:restriction system protein
MWMIRAERDGILIRHFLNEGIAHLGWGVGPIHPTDTTADIRLRLEDTYPYENPGALPNIVGMLRRFSCEVRIGDAVVTYDPQRRQYHIGIVKSDVKHRIVTWVDLATRDDFDDLGYVRKVDWVSAISRDSLSSTARKGLNPQLSHYRISAKASEEIRRLCA